MSNQPLPLRRQQRVRLPQPLRATVDDQRAFIIDASMSGLLVSHLDLIGDVGTACVVRCEWEGQAIELHCKVIRTDPYDLAHLHTGLAIARTIGASSAALRRLIQHATQHAVEHAVEHAPDAQAEPSSGGLIRHELTMGKWREVRTLNTTQPDHGFTIAASHAEHEVTMLRSAYERAFAKGDHEIIRRLAAMSIGESPD